FFQFLAPTELYTLSLHDALPIYGMGWLRLDWDEGPGIGGPHAPYFQSQRYDRHRAAAASLVAAGRAYYCYCSAERLREERERARSEEHTSELQSLAYLVCRLLLE